MHGFWCDDRRELLAGLLGQAGEGLDPAALDDTAAQTAGNTCCKSCWPPSLAGYGNDVLMARYRYPVREPSATHLQKSDDMTAARAMHCACASLYFGAILFCKV